MTDIQTTRFTRKPLHVEGIQVTDENMEALAEWCKGDIRKSGHRRYIHLFLKSPRTPRQSVAYRGDWITKVGPTFKAWTNKSFRATFDGENQGAKAHATIIDEVNAKTLEELLPPEALALAREINRKERGTGELRMTPSRHNSVALRMFTQEEIEEPVSACSREENCKGCYRCHTIDYHVRGEHVATSEPTDDGFRITPTTP